MMKKITSSGLPRLEQLMTKSSVAFITAFREYRTLEENIALNKQLAIEIRNKNFGFVPIKGTWEEEGEPVQYDRSFAISRTGVTFDVLVGAALALVQPYDQRTIMVVSQNIAHFISAQPENFGEEVGTASQYKKDMLDEWMGESPNRYRGKSTMVRGPSNRSFAFSSFFGEYKDYLTEQPIIARRGLLSLIEKMAEPYLESKFGRFYSIAKAVNGTM